MKALRVLENETMSSLAIAKLTGKDHSHVLRDIRRMLEDAEIAETKFGFTYLSSNNKQLPYFKLPRRECDLLMSGYSVKYRLLIIDRWQELEVLTKHQEVKIQSLEKDAFIKSQQALIEAQNTIIKLQNESKIQVKQHRELKVKTAKQLAKEKHERGRAAFLKKNFNIGQ